MELDKNIAIIGTAGIPMRYGGFETLAEYLTKYLNRRIDFTVYCSAKHYGIKKEQHNNSKLKYINLDANGVQSILYDMLSLFHATRRHNQILILGVSGCIILPIFRTLFPQKRLIINIDGLEHQREKWKPMARKFLKYSERLAVKYGDVVVTDNKAIQNYVKAEYNKDSAMIAYGGDHAKQRTLTDEIKLRYSLPDEYAFKVCRIEPENNIHLILKAFTDASLPLVLIGNWKRSEYGRELKQRYSNFEHIYLIDPIYDQEILDQIRSNCLIYIHGHSAGGTNPSLVEAMSLGLPIISFDVPYNRETTRNKAKYFKSPDELREIIYNISKPEIQELGKQMKLLSDREYTWERITNQYYELFKPQS